MLFFVDLFLFLHDLMRLLQPNESIYYLFYWYNLLLLFCFLSNQDNLYMIHCNSGLLYDIYNTIMNTAKDKLTTFHWFFQVILIYFFELFRKFFYNFFCFIIHHDFYIATFWMDFTCCIIINFRRNKINCFC